MKRSKPHSKSKLIRNRVRKHEIKKREEEEERKRRDMTMTAEHGEKGHNVCGRKIRYESKGKALSRASQSVYHGANSLRAYQCPYCHGWHLTSRV